MHCTVIKGPTLSPKSWQRYANSWTLKKPELPPSTYSEMARWGAKNRTLIEMLRGRLQENQEDWDLQLQTCMMAYRSSVHESTGETPNMSKLGREIKVPLDVITEPPPDSPPLTTEYPLALQQRLLGAHELAR